MLPMRTRDTDEHDDSVEILARPSNATSTNRCRLRGYLHPDTCHVVKQFSALFFSKYTDMMVKIIIMRSIMQADVIEPGATRETYVAVAGVTVGDMVPFLVPFGSVLYMLNSKLRNVTPQQAGILFRAGKVLGLPLAIVSFIIIYNAEHILKSANQPQLVAKISGEYFRAFSAAPIFRYWGLTTQAFILTQPQMNSRVIFMSSLLALLCVGVLMPPLLKSRLHIAGAGLVASINEIIKWGMQEAYIHWRVYAINQAREPSQQAYALYRTQNGLRSEASAMREIVTEGYSIPICLLVELWIGIFLFSMYAGWLGSDALANYGLSVALIEFTIVPLLALQTTAASNITVQNPQRAKRQIRSLLTLGTVFSVGMLFLVLLAPQFIIDRFAPESDAEQIDTSAATKLLFLAAIQNIFTAAQLTLLGACQGLKKTSTSRKVVLATSGLSALSAGVCSQFTSLGVQGIYVGALPSWLISNLLLLRIVSQALPANTTRQRSAGCWARFNAQRRQLASVVMPGRSHPRATRQARTPVV